MLDVQKEFETLNAGNENIVAMLLEEHRRGGSMTDGLSGIQELCRIQFEAIERFLETEAPNLARCYASKMKKLDQKFTSMIECRLASPQGAKADRAELIFEFQRVFHDLDRDLT